MKNELGRGIGGAAIPLLLIAAACAEWAAAWLVVYCPVFGL